MAVFPATILLATDGSEETTLAPETASELSKSTGSEVHLVYVLPTPAQMIGHHLLSGEASECATAGTERDAETFLKEQAEKVGSNGGKVAETHLRTGEPDKEILRTAEAIEAGVILIGSRGLGRDHPYVGRQPLRLRRPPRPLPGLCGAQVGTSVATHARLAPALFAAIVLEDVLTTHRCGGSSRVAGHEGVQGSAKSNRQQRPHVAAGTTPGAMG